MTAPLAQPYPERIAGLGRLLERTRQQYMDADHMLRLRDTECRRLRSEASENMAEIADAKLLIADLRQQVDRLEQERDELIRANQETLDNYVAVRASREFLEEGGNRQAARIKDVVDANAEMVAHIQKQDWEIEQQASVIREQGAEIERLKAGVEQMLAHEHGGGNGWWKGWDMLKATADTGQFDLPPTRGETDAMASPAHTLDGIDNEEREG